IDNKNYPRLRAGPIKTILVSRFIYFINFGVFNELLNVLHKCDNPKCLNPNHLFLGTLQINSLDRDNKGRTNLEGLRNIWKADSHIAFKIRFYYANLNITQKDLAKHFNMSVPCI